MNKIQLKSIPSTFPILTAVIISIILVVFASLFSVGYLASAGGNGGGDGGGQNNSGTNDPFGFCGNDTGFGAHAGGVDTTSFTPPSTPVLGCGSAPNACGAVSGGTATCGVTTAGPDAPEVYSCSCPILYPPALPALYGKVCESEANSCGMKTTGTIQCDGGCSAITPSDALCGTCDPSYGNSCPSAANICGMTTDTASIQCDGSCGSAPAPSDSLCTTTCVATYGDSCTSQPNSCGDTTGTTSCEGVCIKPNDVIKYTACTVPTACGGTLDGISTCGGTCQVQGDPNNCQVLPITLTADPMLIPNGATTTVTWNDTATLPATVTCVISAGDNALWITQSGSQDVTLTKETTFKLTCKDSANASQGAISVTVKIVPRWQEF